MNAPRRWVDDPAAPEQARDLMLALKSEPLPPARKDRLFRGLVVRRVRLLPIWLALLGMAAAAGSYAGWVKPVPVETETALFERGVRAREASDAEAALSIFREYGRRFPHGALAAEAGVERIDALFVLGRKDEAREEARRFKTGFPGVALPGE